MQVVIETQKVSNIGVIIYKNVLFYKARRLMSPGVAQLVRDRLNERLIDMPQTAVHSGRCIEIKPNQLRLL